MPLILLGLVLVAAYNFWGKRFPLPPVTDLVLGLSVACLVMYGAVVAGDPSELTFLVAAYGAVHTALVTLHGALRDLANDIRCGVFTSVMFLGAKEEDGALLITRRLWIYGLILNLILVGLIVFGLVGEVGNSARFGEVRLTVIVLLTGLSLLLIAGVYTLRPPLWNLATGLHVIVPYMPIMLLGFHYFPPMLQIFASLTFTVPLVIVYGPIALGGYVTLGEHPSPG